jgi:hypothetical protein
MSTIPENARKQIIIIGVGKVVRDEHFLCGLASYVQKMNLCQGSERSS